MRVVFSDGTRQRPQDYLLAREGSRWVLEDIRYEDGATFRELLRAGPLGPGPEAAGAFARVPDV